MRSFYKEALGGVDIPGFDQPIRVGGMRLNFRELEDWVRPTWPGGDMQIHFEFLVPIGQLEQQEARLISLGAEKSPHQDPDDPGLIVSSILLVTRSASSKIPSPTSRSRTRTVREAWLRAD